MLQPAFAAAGSLDPSFSSNGKQLTDGGAGVFDHAEGVVVQTDGKIVVAFSRDHPANDFGLARYKTDGDLDPTFGSGGIVTTRTSSDDNAYDVALQSDGKIVVAGGTSDPLFEFLIARYLSDGTPDPSFGNQGIVKTPIDPYRTADEARAVAIQSDGKIVAAGTSQSFDTGAEHVSVARYDSNGSPDATFSGDGKLKFGFGNKVEAGTAVAIQADGKIVVGGWTFDPTSLGNFALARFNPAGTYDTTFSADGKLRTNWGYDDRLQGLALRYSRIIAVGSVSTRYGPRFGMARYLTSNGALDTTFSSDGKQTVNFGGAVWQGGSDVTVQGDKKIVVAGTVASTGNNDDNFAICRLFWGGSLDTSFSGDGKLTTDFAGGLDRSKALARQPDGKIVVVGLSLGTNGGEIALARYLVS